MKNRKLAESEFLKRIKAISTNDDNYNMYVEYFKSLSDAAFDKMVSKLEQGDILPYYSANMGKNPVDITKVLKVGDSLGIDFFERIWMTDSLTGTRYLSADKYMIVDLPIRRQAQHLTKGKSVTENSRYVDELTGQPTGPSRTSRMSLPEIMILESAGHDSSIKELIKTRGGDNEAFRASRRQLMDTGEYSLDVMDQLNSRPSSTESLRAFLLGMHIDNNV